MVRGSVARWLPICGPIITIAMRIAIAIAMRIAIGTAIAMTIANNYSTGEPHMRIFLLCEKLMVVYLSAYSLIVH